MKKKKLDLEKMKNDLEQMKINLNSVTHEQRKKDLARSIRNLETLIKAIQSKK